MSQRLLRLCRALKDVAARLLYREGSIRQILAGPCCGLRYKIFPQFGLSHLYGGWESEVQQIMITAIKPGNTAYDLGANYGMHALLMALLVGPSGCVYVFEPVPSMFKGPSENVRINHLDQIQCIEAAVGDRSGKVEFEAGHHLGAGHFAGTGSAGAVRFPVDVLTLDELVFERNARPPDFIKIDIEGAEAKALFGARGVLKAFHPVCIIDLHNPDQDVKVGAFLSQLGY